MPFKLNTVASYDPDSDTISGEVFLLDTATNILHPEFVTTGTVQLLYNNRKISEIRFDKYFGNADGTFKFTMAHPEVKNGLTFNVGITSEQIPSLSCQGNVIYKEVNETSPKQRDPLPQSPRETANIIGTLRGIIIATCVDNTISVELSLVDPITNVLHPEEVASGKIQLLYNQSVLSEILFDRNFGNADGLFKFSIINPGITNGLMVRTLITTIHIIAGTTLNTLSGVGPVIHTTPGTIPLSPTPSPAVTDFRGVLRLQEFGSLPFIEAQKQINQDFPTRIIYPSSNLVIHKINKELKSTLSITDRVDIIQWKTVSDICSIIDGILIES